MRGNFKWEKPASCSSESALLDSEPPLRNSLGQTRFRLCCPVKMSLWGILQEAEFMAAESSKYVSFIGCMTIKVWLCSTIMARSCLSHVLQNTKHHTYIWFLEKSKILWAELIWVIYWCKYIYMTAADYKCYLDFHCQNTVRDYKLE